MDPDLNPNRNRANNLLIGYNILLGIQRSDRVNIAFGSGFYYEKIMLCINKWS